MWLKNVCEEHGGRQGFIRSSVWMFWFSSRNNKPAHKGWEGIAPGLNDPVQAGHASMAEGANKLSRSNSVAAALSVDWFLIFFFFFLS